MNLAEIKKELGVDAINLKRVLTVAEEKTSWLKEWNNDKRIAILIHEKTLDIIKESPTISTLGINTQIKQGAQGEYVAKTIVVYGGEPEAVL